MSLTYLMKRYGIDLSNISSQIKHMSVIPKDLTSYIKPTDMQKRYLIWSGKYKTMAEIPERVSIDVLMNAKTKCRVRGCNWMIGFALIGCVIMIYRGKQAAARGESVAKMNLDWHAKYNEEAKKKE